MKVSCLKRDPLPSLPPASPFTPPVSLPGGGNVAPEVLEASAGPFRQEREPKTAAQWKLFTDSCRSGAERSRFSSRSTERRSDPSWHSAHSCCLLRPLGWGRPGGSEGEQQPCLHFHAVTSGFGPGVRGKHSLGPHNSSKTSQIYRSYSVNNPLGDQLRDPPLTCERALLPSNSASVYVLAVLVRGSGCRDGSGGFGAAAPVPFRTAAQLCKHRRAGWLGSAPLNRVGADPASSGSLPSEAAPELEPARLILDEPAAAPAGGLAGAAGEPTKASLCRRLCPGQRACTCARARALLWAGGGKVCSTDSVEAEPTCR